MQYTMHPTPYTRAFDTRHLGLNNKGEEEGKGADALLEQAAEHAVAAQPEHLGGQTRLAGTTALTYASDKGIERGRGVMSARARFTSIRLRGEAIAARQDGTKVLYAAATPTPLPEKVPLGPAAFWLRVRSGTIRRESGLWRREAARHAPYPE